MIMPSNHSSPPVHYWAGAYPGRIGWLIGPSAIRKTKLRDWMPFALDNDAYSAWSKNTPWSETAWREMIQIIRMSQRKPLWCLIPDVVADREATLEKWVKYAPEIQSLGWPTAFAVQDGMETSDVPDCDLVFIGGTDIWKWTTLKIWTSHFPRVHVGRAGELYRIWQCEDAGAESCDSTSWFRESDDGRKMRQLKDWFNGIRVKETEPLSL